MIPTNPPESVSTARRDPDPVGMLDGLRQYEPDRPSLPIDLWLDANEGPPSDQSVLECLANASPEVLRRYPNAGDLETRIAAHWRIDPERVVVTNGGDDAIDRTCRAFLDSTRALLTHAPTFAMIARSARLCGAAVREVEWLEGGFPASGMQDAIAPGIGLIAMVTPNNPTGCVISLDDLLGIVRMAATRGIAVLVDLAYVEFADEDPTIVLLNEPNVVIIRTFSKSFGLAGLRVGYALASPGVARWLRIVGGPYPVSTPSLRIASTVFGQQAGPAGYPERIKAQRAALAQQCSALGATPIKSHANFLAVRVRDADLVHSALGSLGIAVRRFGAGPLANLLRVTLPGDEPSFTRLTGAIRAALAPEALLFDLDGVLADVSRSYRGAIIETARQFGVILKPEDIEAEKLAGNANNDWELTHRAIRRRGVDAGLQEVVDSFQESYLGRDGHAGLRDHETLIPPTSLLRELAGRIPLAIVTGRPRAEADWFLARVGLSDLFAARVCMEDAPAKPSPVPVRLALEQVGIEHAWMIGDTPDDMRAARSAGVVPIGIPAPADDPTRSAAALREAGAARVITDLIRLQEMIP